MFDYLSNNIVASKVVFTLRSYYLSFIFSFISVKISIPISGVTNISIERMNKSQISYDSYARLCVVFNHLDH